MRSLITCVLLASFAAVGVRAQDPEPVVTKPPQKQTETPVKTGTPKVGDPVAQDPKKQDPVKGAEKDPKANDPKANDPKANDPKAKDPKPADVEKVDPKSESPKGGEVTEVDLPKDPPLPPSADPADLRAMKSAQDMLAAERRLRARIKSGQLKDIDKLLSFEELSSWPYEDGLKGMPKAVKELDGKQVVMIGFMLPIDEVEDIKEFLLVQSLWACCYGQPPDINGIVRVVMKGDRRCDYQFDPILVKGTFKVEATLEDGYCIDIYQLHATEVSLLK